MSATYFDLDPNAVAAAGRATSATASTWAAWANRSETVLRNCAEDVQEGSLSSAIEGFVSDLNPVLKALAKRVDALGTNTVSAAHTMANSDTASTAVLGQQGQRTDDHTRALRRPINH
jgi:hypothetical protein